MVIFKKPGGSLHKIHCSTILLYILVIKWRWREIVDLPVASKYLIREFINFVRDQKINCSTILHYIFVKRSDRYNVGILKFLSIFIESLYIPDAINTINNQNGFTNQMLEIYYNSKLWRFLYNIPWEAYEEIMKGFELEWVRW